MDIPANYIELGLYALARSGEKGWFDGHFGAALLSAFYLNEENSLPDHVKNGLIRNCEYYLERYPLLFTPFAAEEADQRYVEYVLKGIEANLETLRSSGHGVILGVIGLKALKDRPDLCTMSIAKGIYQTIMHAAKDRPNRYYGFEDYTSLNATDVFGIPAYQSISDIVEICFAELQIVIPNQKWGEVFYHFTGELEHGVTFAHALVELDHMGYSDLTKKGFELHRLQMYLNRQRPGELIHQAITQPSFHTLTDRAYWEKIYNDPHSLKVPYSALCLFKYLPEKKRAKAEYNLCKILCQNK